MTLWLQPEDLSAGPPADVVERWRIGVATAAARCRAPWDADGIDAFLGDARSAGTDATSFFTLQPPAFRVHFVIRAATAREATETAALSCLAPCGFAVRWTARPADLDHEEPAP